MNQRFDNSIDEQPGAEADDSLLVAYLDGELSDVEMLQLEDRLTGDAELCKRLHGLQKSWDLLDQLPVKPVNDSFTRSTIEMIIQQEFKQTKSRWQLMTAWPVRMAIAFTLFLAAALISYIVARHQQLGPQRELIKNLAFLEKADLYTYVPSIEFLQKLNDHGALPEKWLRDAEQIEEDDIVEVTDNVELSPATRLSHMSDEQRNELRIRKDRFEQLSPIEQIRRRQLHDELLMHPQSERLFTVAEEFERWLRSIDVAERTTLLTLENVDKQLEFVQRIRAEQESKFFGLAGATALPKQDVGPFSDWVEEFVRQRSERFLNQTNPRLRQNFSRASKTLQPYLIFLAFSRATPEDQLLDDPALENMLNVLSLEAKEILDLQEDGEARRKLALAWISNACRAKIHPPLTDQDLFNYLKTLPAESQHRYDDMNPSQWRRELERAYYRDYQMN